MNQQNYVRFQKEKIVSWLFQGKVIIVYGARQVGKTTLVKEIIEETPGSVYFNCERHNIKTILESGNLESIRDHFGQAKLVVLDEAQKIKGIGSLLKLLTDTWPEIQLIATGSSSFNLISELSEPLTGRNVKFLLLPLALTELKQKNTLAELDEKLESYLRFGMYPGIVDRDNEKKMILLDELASDYLYRDVLMFENLKNPELLTQILKALALQLGNEVSYRELSTLLKVSVAMIQKYIQVLERSFIIYRLTSFSRNLRNELTRSHKYYFYDLGVRNSLLQNFNLLQNRNDTGFLWENFCMIERLKINQRQDLRKNLYFWRTYQQQEIDLIEEYGGRLSAYEFKWTPGTKTKPPDTFMRSYPGSDFHVIHPENYHSFLLE
ncbi:MAG: ATP-binding protein [Bacteroidetes bacterium]|nr:ATP-binding protein [Bacteroidota bacterium]